MCVCAETDVFVETEKKAGLLYERDHEEIPHTHAKSTSAARGWGEGDHAAR